MNKTTTYLFAMLCGLMVVGYGCRQQQPRPEVAKATHPAHTFSIDGPVRQMAIWPETFDLPEYPGKALFVSYCGICHSLRYITAQPPFQRATWEAEVHKMVEKYGAPIDSATGAQIVDYLVALNGR